MTVLPCVSRKISASRADPAAASELRSRAYVQGAARQWRNWQHHGGNEGKRNSEGHRSLQRRAASLSLPA
jgi:hypothetical protein